MNSPDNDPGDGDRRKLRAAYDRVAAEYGKVRNAVFDGFRDEILDWFAAQVRLIGPRVLDLGSGPGYESAELRERGLTPLAIDFSPGMIDECRSRNIDGAVMDLTALELPSEKYAGALASFSLLHLPKSAASPVLKSIGTSLLPGGVLMILLFEGDGEGPRVVDIRRFGTARYFAYYRATELRDLVEAEFEVIREERLDISPRPTLMIAARKPV